MPDYLPKFTPSTPITRTAAGAITGGLLVTVADVVAQADSVTWLGVASRDAVAGEQYGVWTDDVQHLTAATALPKGTPVKCAANGQVTTWVSGTDNYDRYLGLTIEAIASGVAGPVRMTR